MNRAPLISAASLWQRLSPWAGIAFAVLFVAAFVVAGVSPDYDDPEGWREFHEDSGDRWREIIAAYLGVLSALAFLWFGHALVARLAGSRGGGDVLSAVSRAAVSLAATFVILAFLVATSVSATIELADAPVPESADLGIQLESLGIGILLVGGGLSAALALATISELARESSAWPAWLVWAGFILAAVLLLAPLFVPIAAIPIWALLTGITLLVRSRGLTLAEPPPAAIT